MFSYRIFSVLQKHKVIVFILFACLSGIALFFLQNLSINPEIEEFLPEDDPVYLQDLRLQKIFPNLEYVYVVVEADDLWNREVFSAINRLTVSFADIQGVDSVFSVTNIKDLKADRESLEFYSIFPGELDSRGEQVIEETAFFRKLFLSQDKKAFNIFLYLKEDTYYRDVIPEIKKACGEEPLETHIFGNEVIKFYIDDIISRELMLLGSICLILIFIMQIAVTRSFKKGIILCLGSIIPTLWTIAMFPVLGKEIRIYTVIVPVFVLAISTSYGIHVFRNFIVSEHDSFPEKAGEIAPVVFYTGLTTIFGFSALLFTSIEILRVLGMFIIFGVFYSFLTALFFIPLLLHISSRDREVKSSGIAEFFLRNLKSRNIVIFVVLLCVCGAGIFFIHLDFRRSSSFKKGSAIADLSEYFYARNGGYEEIDLLIDTEEEYGFVAIEKYRALKKFISVLERRDDVASVVSFIDPLEWLNGRLYGSKDDLAPESIEQLGEALELLSSQDISLGINNLIDISYSKARVSVRFGNIHHSPKEADEAFQSLKREIHEAFKANFPDSSLSMGGLPLRMEKYSLYFIKGQVKACIAFLIMLFLFLSFIFRSVKLAFITMVPPVSSLVLFFGLMGWFGIPLHHFSSYMIALVLGVSSDDALYFNMILRNQRKSHSFSEALSLTFLKTGTAIISTTLLIIIASSALLLSQFKPLAYATLLVILVLSLCTVITCFIIPVLVRRIDGT